MHTIKERVSALAGGTNSRAGTQIYGLCDGLCEQGR